MMPPNWPPGVPFPPKIQAVMREQNTVLGYLKQDFETFYIFGGILLDQWSLQATAVANLRSLPGKYPFRELVEFLERKQESLLSPLWHQFKEQILWLYYQIRFYRNRFVVHANRPWQRGNTRGLHTKDFRLHTPTPPGWLDDVALNNTIMALRPVAEKVIPTADLERMSPGALIEALFNSIGGPSRKKCWTRDQLAKAITDSQETAKGGETAGRPGKAAKRLERPTQSSFVYKGVVEDVVDGDTLVIRFDLGFLTWRSQRIRLAGVDALPIEEEEGRYLNQELLDKGLAMPI